MDPWSPISGISLERYADLCAEVDGVTDAEKQAEAVAALGVARADWEAAKSGWTARMQDMTLMGQVATRFMPMYQAALARKMKGQQAHAYGQQPYPPPANPFGTPQQQASFDRQLGGAFSALGNALNQAVTTVAMSVGSRVMVQWSNGQRYPATVTQMAPGQVHVTFPDGQQHWVPQPYVTLV